MCDDESILEYQRAQELKVERLCARIQRKYETTKATATQCFEELDRGLNEIVQIEHAYDFCDLWDWLHYIKNLEQKWDSLSVEEQAEYSDEKIPKGKTRKKRGEKAEPKGTSTDPIVIDDDE